MVRAASGGEGSITEISDAFGFSRKSYYQIRRAFDLGGICALVPKKTGPKGPNKLSTEVLDFIDSFFNNNKDAKATQASAALEREKGIKVHPRTIYRHLKKN
jgi:transposase